MRVLLDLFMDPLFQNLGREPGKHSRSVKDEWVSMQWGVRISIQYEEMTGMGVANFLREVVPSLPPPWPSWLLVLGSVCRLEEASSVLA